MKRTGIPVVPLRGQKAVLVPLGEFNLKRSTAGVFVVPLRVLSRKYIAGDNLLCKNWYLLGLKIISSHPYKTGS